VLQSTAPSGEVLFSTRVGSHVVGRRLAELAHDVRWFRLDGTVYPASEWRLARTIASGEEGAGEELSSWDLMDDRSHMEARDRAAVG
jgi:hypothetical protein